jgi:hypothetical protein
LTHLVEVNEDGNAQMAAAAASVKRAARGISTFLLNANDLKHEGLFKHMVQWHLNNSTYESHVSSTYLDGHCSEVKVQEFGPDAKDLQKCSIMSYDHGARATMKLRTRKLDNLGYVKS